MDELIDTFQKGFLFVAMLSNLRTDSHVLQSQLDVQRITSLSPNAAQLHLHLNVMTDLGKQGARFQPSFKEESSTQLVSYEILPTPLTQVGKAFV